MKKMQIYSIDNDIKQKQKWTNLRGWYQQMFGILLGKWLKLLINLELQRLVH